MEGLIAQVTNWEFLNEPAYRWVIFFIGASFFLWVWNDVLSLMK